MVAPSSAAPWTEEPRSVSGVALPDRTVSQDAREEILSYRVRVQVADGGRMRVTEELRVRALGRAIRRGIYRDFPTSFPRETGIGSVTAPFRVVSVSRDGRPEPFRLERVGGPARRGGVRVRIGDPDRLLPHGVHSYVLVYETSRWMRFGDRRDRLDWNVTGNGWDFRIDTAAVVLDFPDRTPRDSVRLEAWTGPEGSTAQDASWSWSRETNEARFRTTTPLGPHEGLTVRADLPTGVVLPPTPEQEAAWRRLDWGGFGEAGVVVGLVLAVYLFMWTRVGRDPRAGPVVVQYEPPDGFSAAELGFLRDRGYRPSELTAALVALAVKGAVTIERDGHEWTIRATGHVPDDLAPEERALLDEAVGSGRSSLILDGHPDSTLRKAVKKLRGRLSRGIEKRYLRMNRAWFAAGLAVSLVGMAALAWLARSNIDPASWFLLLWITLWTMGTATLVIRIVQSWKLVGSGNVAAGIGAGLLTVFALPFLGAEVVVGYLLYQGMPTYVVLAAAVVGALNVAFYHLLERPTLAGRGVLDAVAGFRRFLGATEEDRLNRLQPPEGGLELFERYLPYAVALGVENEWAGRFEGALAPATEAPSAGSGAGALPWYSGGAGGGLSAMTSALGGSLASSLTASSAAPSSSGSGGGGGFSGGGGGGGGGGGW